MALQGTLDTFSLPDVLRLLATTSKTGRLRIEGDRGRGSVWLADGGVVDADADRTLDGTPVDEVVFELLRFESGNFAFDGDDTASAAGDPEEVDALLGRADALLGEWNELEAVVPSLEHEVTLARDLSADEVTISADHWPSLVAVSSGRTVGELASSLGLTELGVSRAVRDLVELGVVDVARPDRTRAAAAPVAQAAPSPTTRDLPRRPAARPEVDAPAVPGVPAPPAGHSQRAGWLGERTGEFPTPVVDTPPAGTVNGGERTTHEVPAAPPAPPEPAPKGGLASRIGRNRNGSAAARNADTTPANPTPPATNGTRHPGRTPAAPTARTNDAGPVAEPPADAGRPPHRRHPTAASTRRRRPAGRSAPGGLSEWSGARRPRRPRRRRSTTAASARRRSGATPGRSAPCRGSALPPDLHWAADDTGNIPISGSVDSPFSGLSSLAPGGRPTRRPVRRRDRPARGGDEPRGPRRGPVDGGQHRRVAGARGGSQGEEIAQRGRLISFLSSVR